MYDVFESRRLRVQRFKDFAMIFFHIVCICECLPQEVVIKEAKKKVNIINLQVNLMFIFVLYLSYFFFLLLRLKFQFFPLIALN